jgi:hypothetical protein
VPINVGGEIVAGTTMLTSAGDRNAGPFNSPENGGPGGWVMAFSIEITEDTEHREEKKEVAADSHRLTQIRDWWLVV